MVFSQSGMDVAIRKVYIMKRLKIYVVLPMYGGSLPIGHYCIAALREMGHFVGVFEAPVLLDAFHSFKKLKLNPDVMGQLEQGFLNLVSQAIWSQVQSFRPDFILALAQAPIGKRLLTKFRSEGLPTAMWFVEDYKLFPYWKIVAPLYTVFAVIQKEPFLSELHKIGQNNVLYLPLAAHPQIHKKVELSPGEKEEYGSEISFMGAGYPNRRIAFRSFKEKDFKIWGSDWDDEEILKNKIQRNGERISEEDSVKIYSASKINLNLHSSLDSHHLVSGGDFVNPRTFELASIGAFQLVDKRTLMDELFTDDELATFHSLDELNEKIDYFLKNEEERNKYIINAQKRVLKEHTYIQRMKVLIDFIQKIAGKFETKAAFNLAEEFQEPVKSEITKLFEKLETTPDESFEEIIMKLRQRSGTLNPVEMAFLFLDEFQKQYKK